MLRHALILAAAGGVASVAHAASHTVASNNLTPILLSGGFGGQFDIRPLLAGNSRVTQASILFGFIDDVEQYRKVTQPSAGFVRTGVETVLTQQYAGFSYTTRQVEMLQTIRNQITDITAESVTLTVAGSSRSGGTQGNAGNQLVGSQSSRVQVRSNCLDYMIIGNASLCTLQEVFYTQTISDYYGKAGAFDVTFDPLDALALADLNLDGLLDFNGQVNSGDLHLQHATMRLEVIMQAPDNGVPEPSLPALLGIGLLAMLRRARAS